jgi:hypothetical protein
MLGFLAGDVELFIIGDGFLVGRSAQITTLANHARVVAEGQSLCASVPQGPERSRLHRRCGIFMFATESIPAPTGRSVAASMMSCRRKCSLFFCDESRFFGRSFEPNQAGHWKGPQCELLISASPAFRRFWAVAPRRNSSCRTIPSCRSEPIEPENALESAAGSADPPVPSLPAKLPIISGSQAMSEIHWNLRRRFWVALAQGT